jgi:hypothetical protein
MVRRRGPTAGLVEPGGQTETGTGLGLSLGPCGGGELFFARRRATSGLGGPRSQPPATQDTRRDAPCIQTLTKAGGCSGPKHTQGLPYLSEGVAVAR